MASLPTTYPLLGWKLFPVEANGKRPLTLNGFKDASSDPAQHQAWARQHPYCNWAVATGEASSIFVVDVDGKAGEASLASILNGGLELPPTLTANTGRADGGWHLYFAMPPGIDVASSTGKLGAGLDVKGNGGYVVIPPSTHSSGKQYTFVNPNVPVAVAPSWLLERIAGPKLDVALPMFYEGRTQATEREKLYAVKALKDETDKLSAMTRNRNAALNTAALHLGEMVGAGWIQRADVEQALWEASKANGYRLKDGDNEARKTLQSGLTSGMQNPRATLEQPLAFDPASLTANKPQFEIQSVPFALADNNSIPYTIMSELTPKAIEWLWYGLLAKGKLALLAGAPSAGKSTLAFSFAAIVSSGGTWPDGTRCKIGNVVIWSSEDDSTDTILPRLLAMGADTKRIIYIHAKFNPAKDVQKLKQLILAKGGASLVILDPITSAVAGDMNKSNEVRQGLQDVVDLASECNCVVVGITHFAKGTQGRNPAERVIGSVAFGAFARIVLVAAKDEETGQRVLVKAKSNISDDKGGFHYAIQCRPLDNGNETTCIDWGGPVEGSSREILATVEHQEDKDSDSRNQAVEANKFLIEELKNGPRYARELIDMADQQFGIKERTLQRARKKLAIQINNEGPNKGWKWSLPLCIPFNPTQGS